MKKTIVAMIPCRLGSQRVVKKNVRYLGAKLLCEWVIAACQQAGVFDAIYLNSEALVFQDIARKNGISFYQRPEQFATSSATNDEFALDFIQKIPCDILVQVNPTSPFTDPADIRALVAMFQDGGYQTVHTVKAEQIEALFEGRPLNFDPVKPMPRSQDLQPAHVFTSSIMAWDTAHFQQHMRELGCAVYGGRGKIGYYTVKGMATLDIDNEFDFQVAEAFVNRQSQEPRYYESGC